MGIFKKIAEIFRKIIIGYVYYSFPLTVIAFMICGKYLAPYLKSDPSFQWEQNYGILLNTLIHISIAQALIWIPMSLLFVITLFFSRKNRESFFKMLSGIKERDEREVQIVGKALRASYLTTMTIILFMFFISFLSVEISIKPADNVETGKSHRIISSSLGIEHQLTYPGTEYIRKEGNNLIIQHLAMPVTPPALFLILLLWQIVSFKIVSRKLFKQPPD